MRVFVGYGYNDRDRWIERLVFPIITAFGDEVITGGNLQGESIPDAVRRKIRESHALIGFLTRRGEQSNADVGPTHRWVSDEIAIAIAQGLPVLEVREKGVDAQGGSASDRQYVVYDEQERDICLVEIVKTIGKWHQTSSVTLQLLPPEAIRSIIPFLRNRDLRCTYRLLIDGEESEPIPVTIRPIKGGLFITARNVPREALVQVEVSAQGKTWVSDYEGTDALGIPLRKG